MSDDIDRILRPRVDRPALHSKWAMDMQNKWDNIDYPSGYLPKCRYFMDDFRQCADGLSWDRAKKECRNELEDMRECQSGYKVKERHAAILKQRKKLIKEGKYTPPPFPESLPPFHDTAI